MYISIIRSFFVNTKIALTLSSLLLYVCFLQSNDIREEYEKHYHWSEIEKDKAQAARTAALKILKQTRKGHLYQVNLEAWHSCMDFSIDNWDEKSAMCEKFMQATEDALTELKETPEYKAYQSISKNTAYNENLARGLRNILYAETDYSLDKGWSKEYREEKLNDVINSNTIGDRGKASNKFLDWTEDIQDDEKRAQEELRSIVKNIEANNHPIQN